MIIERFKTNPKKLLIIDGVGAIISAFLLGVVLVIFENIFGIPKQTLYILASLPVLFAIYDLYAFKQENNKIYMFIKNIALLNILYCFISIGFAFYHIETIKFFGWIYIIVEIFIVAILASIELKISRFKIKE